MNPREIREQLGRVKPYFLRNEPLRALAATVTGLKGLGATAPTTDIRSVLREAVQLLAKDEEICKFLKAPLAYQPGQERTLLATLSKVYQDMRAASEKEDKATALARKVKLDQTCNQGFKLLEQGNISEADACFAEAIKYYKDEHRVFVLIGRKLMAVGEVRRAAPYFKRGVEVNPSDAVAKQLLDECLRLRDQQKETTAK